MVPSRVFSLIALAFITSNAFAQSEVELFNGKDLTGWKIFPAKAEKTFSVVDGYIKVTGSPAGYFYTDKSFKNMVLTYDWRFKRPEKLEDDKKFGGNSGLLLHITGDHKVWPNCLEIQGANGSHASFISIGKTGQKEGKFDGKALAAARKPVGEWNTTEVTVKDGAVSVKVNGTPVSSCKIDLLEGPFGFQSEGSEIHYKNIKIKNLN